MRPKPSRSYSAEKGFELMRISRIESRGGSRPPVKPSMKICPPFGPADGPANACKASANSSGSSGRDSMSVPRRTIAPALFSGSVLTGGSLATVTSVFSIVTLSVMSRDWLRAAVTSTLVFSKGAKPAACARMVYVPGASPLKTYVPSSFVVAVFSAPLASTAKTVAPIITPPN